MIRFRFASIAFFLLSAIGVASCGREKGPPPPSGAQTHGVVYAVFTGGTPGDQNRVFVPGVRVYLKNLGTNDLSSKAVTNVRGWYSIPHVPAGSYQLCWEAESYTPGCTSPKEKIVIANNTATPGPVAIEPRQPSLAGKTTFASGFPCFAQDPALGLDVRSKVTLLDSSGAPVGRTVSTDQFGNFIIPELPPAATQTAGLKLRTECGGASTDTPLPSGIKTPVRVAIPDTAPLIVAVSAGGSDRPTNSAAPGEVVPVSVTVQNATGGRLHYRWFPSDSGPDFVSLDEPSVKWPLPKWNGLHNMQVLVTNENGGHSIGQVSVSTGGPEIFFSGTVVDQLGAPLGGATVSLNGVTTATNAQGYFFIQLPRQSPRYILNISKDGYALFSRPFVTEKVGATFSLVQAQTIRVDPRQPIDIAQEFTSGARRGAELRLEPNSLVDSDGHLPLGPLNVSISTIDLRDPIGRLPGNSGGVDVDGKSVRISSYGGVDVRFSDSTGRTFNLAPDHSATLRIPVDAAAEQVKPPLQVAPLWFYDQQEALWRQAGSAQLTDHAYEARVSHFSAIDVGVASSDAACMRLHFDPGTVNFPFTLNVSVPTATGAVSSSANPLTSAATDIIAELPPNEPITLQIDTVELSLQYVNSGPATPGPANPNPAPASCGSDAYLAVAPVSGIGTVTESPDLTPGGFLDYFGLDDEVSADAYYAAIDPTSAAGVGTVSSAGATVTGVGTSFASFFVPGDMIQAAGQVRTIQNVSDDTHLTTFTVLPAPGPTPIPPGSSYAKVGTKTTLDRFKSQNGFTADLATAVYLNANDLGFGRGMHMWKSGGNIFYYVTNFPDVESARLGINTIATVAMEYSPNPLSGGPYTKFYVFNAQGARVNNANLDQRGRKFVPRLCVICHGGAYVAPTSTNHGDMGSRFIAFDLASYGYSGFDPSFSRGSQEEAFRLLNQGVLENTNPSNEQQELINGWYGGAGGVDTAHQTQIDGFVPAGWNTQATLYTDVVRPSCRTCHVTRDPPLDWNRFSGGSLLFDYVHTGLQQNGPTVEPFLCDMRIMPHAKVTYINFWSHSTSLSSPNRLAELQNAGLTDFLATDACPLQ
jgi:hypothetical protein